MHGAAEPSDACEAWSQCKKSLRSISLARTKTLRLQNTERAASLKAQINQGRVTVEDRTAPQGAEETIRRLRQELSDLTPVERTLNQTLENIAYTSANYMTSALPLRSDASTAAPQTNGSMRS